MDGASPPKIWHDIGTIEDIPRQAARVVIAGDMQIAVFRTEDDQIFALEDRCPHRQGRLSQGIVHGHAVTCPLHGWVIGLEDGEATAPDEGCVTRIAVRRDGTRLMLALPA